VRRGRRREKVAVAESTNIASKLKTGRAVALPASTSEVEKRK
jgi:hypothetical protein